MEPTHLAECAVPTQRQPPLGATRALLVNPPIYDIRLPWHQWQQPAILLRLSSYLRQNGTEPRLLDYMNVGSGERPRKKTIARLELDTAPPVVVSKWRFGTTAFHMEQRMRSLKDSGWIPDVVYVECFASIWWEGAAESIASVRKIFPDSRILLMGAYVEQAANHARKHSGADVLVEVAWPDVKLCPADIEVFDKPPSYLCIGTGDGSRTADEIVNEIRAARARGTSHFAIVDHDLVDQHASLFRVVLERLVTERIRVKLQALGNVDSRALCEHPDLAALMYRAGYEMVCFSDDRHVDLRNARNDQIAEQAREATILLREGGFRDRTGAVTASVCVGRSGESIEDRAALATLLSHNVGSVIMWPYQPEPCEFPGSALESINGKLFPHRTANEYSYRDYMDLLGLGAVLNAKYRTRTFDFMGDDLIARLLRESVARKGWDPDPTVKGGLQLPLREQ